MVGKRGRQSLGTVKNTKEVKKQAPLKNYVCSSFDPSANLHVDKFWSEARKNVGHRARKEKCLGALETPIPRAEPSRKGHMIDTPRLTPDSQRIVPPTRARPPFAHPTPTANSQDLVEPLRKAYVTNLATPQAVPVALSVAPAQDCGNRGLNAVSRKRKVELRQCSRSRSNPRGQNANTGAFSLLNRAKKGVPLLRKAFEGRNTVDSSHLGESGNDEQKNVAGSYGEKANVNIELISRQDVRTKYTSENKVGFANEKGARRGENAQPHCRKASSSREGATHSRCGENEQAHSHKASSSREGKTASRMGENVQAHCRKASSSREGATHSRCGENVKAHSHKASSSREGATHSRRGENVQAHSHKESSSREGAMHLRMGKNAQAHPHKESSSREGATHLLSGENAQAHSRKASSSRGGATHSRRGENVKAHSRKQSPTEEGATHSRRGENVQPHSRKESPSREDAPHSRRGARAQAHSRKGSSRREGAAAVRRGENAQARSPEASSSRGGATYSRRGGNLQARSHKGSSSREGATYSRRGGNLQAHSHKESSSREVAAASRMGANVRANSLKESTRLLARCRTPVAECRRTVKVSPVSKLGGCKRQDSSAESRRRAKRRLSKPGLDIAQTTTTSSKSTYLTAKPAHDEDAKVKPADNFDDSGKDGLHGPAQSLQLLESDTKGTLNEKALRRPPVKPNWTNEEIVAQAAKISTFLIYMNVAHDLRPATIQDVKDWRNLSLVDQSVLAAICSHRNFLQEVASVHKIAGEFPWKYVKNPLLWNPFARFLSECVGNVRSVEEVLEAEKKLFNCPLDVKRKYVCAR